MTQIKKPGASLKINIAISKKSKAFYLDLYGVSQTGRAQNIEKKREQNEDRGERKNDEGGRFFGGGGREGKVERRANTSEDVKREE